MTWPIIEALAWLPGVFAFRIHAGRVKVPGGWLKLGVEGMPDIGCSVRGKAVFFATEPGYGAVSNVKRLVHQRLREAGADVHIVRSVGEALQVMTDSYGATPTLEPRGDG